MTAFGSSDGHSFEHIIDIHQGATDDEIPPICQERGIAALVTMNVRDFGAKKHYYRRLLEAKVHVVVLRPGKRQPDAGQQLSLIASHWTAITAALSPAESPLLLVATIGNLRVRNVNELVDEIAGPP